MAARRLTAIEVWEHDRSAKLVVPGTTPASYDLLRFVSSVVIREALGEVGREASVSRVTLAPGCPPVVSHPPFLSSRRILRMIYDDATFEEWRVVRFNRELSGESPPALELEPIWSDLASRVVRLTTAQGHVTPVVYLIGRSAADCLSAIMASAPAPWTAGSAGPYADVRVSLVLAGQTHLQALTDLCRAVAETVGQPCEWDYAWTGTGYAVSLTDGVGGVLSHPIEMGYGDRGNRRRLLKQEDWAPYFSRIVPLGGPDEELVTVAHAYWRVISASYDAQTDRTTLVLADDPIYVANYPGNDVEFGRDDVGYWTMLSSTPPATVVLSGDATGLLQLTGRFRRTDGGELIALADPLAEAVAGVVERVERRSDVAPVRNLLVSAGVTADLSHWSGGLPVGVEAIGNATVSPISDPRYVQAGTASADVQGGVGDGIQTAAIYLAPTTEAPYFSAWFGVRILSGAVQLDLLGSDDVSYPTGTAARGEGDFFQGIEIAGLRPPPGPARLRVTCLRANTRFVLDSWTLTQTASAYPWTAQMGPEALWHIGGSLLAVDGGVRPWHLEGEWLDLSYLDPTVDEPKIGGKVQVRDSLIDGVYGVNLEVRLVELERTFSGADFVRRGRFGSRPQDITGWLVGGRRMRMLPSGGEPLLGRPYIDIFPRIDKDGNVSAAIVGNARTRSVKIAAKARARTASEDFPTSAEVYARPALNGQTHTPAAVGTLVVLTPGQVADISAIAFSDPNGEGDESALTRLTFDPQPPDGFIGPAQIADGSIIARKLAASARSFVSAVEFYPLYRDAFAWGAGVLRLADGSQYSINSGQYYGMQGGVIYYVYWDVTQPAVLQVTTDLAQATSDDRLFLAVARKGFGENDLAFVVPAVGRPNLDSMAINDSAITTAKLDAYSVTAEKIAAGAITADKIAANSVTAAHMNVVSLSSISANLGTVTAGTIAADVIVSSEYFTAPVATFAGEVTAGIPELAHSRLVWQGIYLLSGTNLYVPLPMGRFARAANMQDLELGAYRYWDPEPKLKIWATGGVMLAANGGTMSFYGADPVERPIITGSRGGNAALASLLQALATLGLIDDQTTDDDDELD